MVKPLTEEILKDIEKISPLDYSSMNDFCISMVNSTQKSFDSEFEDIQKIDLFELDHYHNRVIESLKLNKNIALLGTGSFSSVFSIINTNKAFKINAASCDSFYDSWLTYAEKIIESKIDNPWIPKIYFLHRQKYFYGAIIDNLESISTCEPYFQKNIVESIKKIIDSIQNADFKGFKSEEKIIAAILYRYDRSESSKQILKALEFILKVKKLTQSEFDIYPQNIMIDKEMNIIINDPLSYNKSGF